MKPYKWTDDRTKVSIIADRAAGLTVREIAKYDMHANTVSRVCRQFAKDDPRTEYAQGILSGYRERLKSGAVKAVESGLDHPDDPYKRGNLGVQVLKGLGEFEQEKTSVHIANLMASVPEQWRSRYVVNDDAS